MAPTANTKVADVFSALRYKRIRYKYLTNATWEILIDIIAPVLIHAYNILCLSPCVFPQKKKQPANVSKGFIKREGKLTCLTTLRFPNSQHFQNALKKITLQPIYDFLENKTLATTDQGGFQRHEHVCRAYSAGTKRIDLEIFSKTSAKT